MAVISNGIVGRQGPICRIAAEVEEVVVAFQQHPQGRRRRPQEAGAEAAGLDLARGARIGAGDLVETVADLGVEGETRRQGVGEGQIDRALQLHVLVAADLAHQIAVDAREVGIPRIDEDRPARRIGAGECALRPPQKLDAADVVIGLGLEIAGEDGNAVTIGRDADADRRGRLGLADAPDVEEIALTEILHRGGRGHKLELLQRGHAPVLEILAAQDRRGDRGFLQVGGPALSRHDDIVEQRVLFGGRIRRRGLGLLSLRRSGPQQDSGRCRYPELAAHGVPPSDVPSGALAAPFTDGLTEPAPCQSSLADG